MTTLATLERRLARLERHAGTLGGWRGYPPPPPLSGEQLRTVVGYLLEAGAATPKHDNALAQMLRRMVELANEQEETA